VLRRAIDLRWAVRRWITVARLRLRAKLKGARVELLLAPTVRLGSHVRFVVDNSATTRLDIGSGCQFEDDVTFHLQGGSLKMGADCTIRRGSVIHLGGELELVGNNIISYYNVIHCAERIHLDRWASTNEFVTIVDSRHFHDGDSEFFYENRESAPIDIGRNVWLANKCSVLMGVTIGDEAIVAAHAVVHGDVPAKAIVGGVPARLIRQR